MAGSSVTPVPLATMRTGCSGSWRGSRRAPALRRACRSRRPGRAGGGRPRAAAPPRRRGSCSRVSLLRGHRVAGGHDQHERVGVERERLEIGELGLRARAARGRAGSCTRSTSARSCPRAGKSRSFGKRFFSAPTEATATRTAPRSGSHRRAAVRRRDHAARAPSRRKPSIATSAARAWGRDLPRPRA